MSEKIDLQPVKGTRDFYPAECAVRNWLFDHWREVAQSFGFQEYDSCVLESEALYVRKAGDEITGQLYNFRDKGDRAVALRPEMTPTLARMVMARQSGLSLPLRWFAIPQCFRYERMQRGRKREHFQWNMDIIGLSSTAAEAELMSAQAAFLRRVGLPDSAIRFHLSHRGVLQHYLLKAGVSPELFPSVCIIVDKHDKIGSDATRGLLTDLGISSGCSAAILELLTVRGLRQLADLVGTDNPGLEDLTSILELATAAGIGDLITIDCSVVRGLSYYTGAVWELFDASGSLPRAIAGGGRYDRLIEALGGEPTPMVGFGFGDVVILELLEEKALLPTATAVVDDVVFPMKSAYFAIANRLAAELRGNRRRVAVDYSQRRFKHVIAKAENDGAQRLFIIGSDEAAAGVAKVRMLGGENREEETFALPR